jgi:translation initiation factor 2 subunit 1
VSPEDIVKCEEKFNKGKMVASIMRHVAEKTKTPMETLYQEIGWPLNKRYGNALDAFKMSITWVVFLGSKSFNSHSVADLQPLVTPTSGIR